MLELAPCPTCSRHVVVRESACPFCGAQTRPPRARATRTVTRLSRAAIFAGAAACYTSTPDAQHPPPPPPPQDVAPPPGDTSAPPADVAPPPDTQTFAQPPASGTARIHGVVRQGKHPLANVIVTLRAHSTRVVTRATTDSRGLFVADKLPPDDYDVTPQYSSGTRFGPQPRRIHLADGGDEQVELEVPLPPQRDSGPCCKPYGAPPARRRVV